MICASTYSPPGSLGKTGGVKLMTVHASKGLEFEHVFVTGLEQDLFPHEKMSEGEISLEDKRKSADYFTWRSLVLKKSFIYHMHKPAQSMARAK